MTTLAESIISNLVNATAKEVTTIRSTAAQIEVRVKDLPHTMAKLFTQSGIDNFATEDKNLEIKVITMGDGKPDPTKVLYIIDIGLSGLSLHVEKDNCGFEVNGCTAAQVVTFIKRVNKAFNAYVKEHKAILDVPSEPLQLALQHNKVTGPIDNKVLINIARIANGMFGHLVRLLGKGNVTDLTKIGGATIRLTGAYDIDTFIGIRFETPLACLSLSNSGIIGNDAPSLIHWTFRSTSKNPVYLPTLFKCIEKAMTAWSEHLTGDTNPEQLHYVDPSNKAFTDKYQAGHPNFKEMLNMNPNAAIDTALFNLFSGLIPDLQNNPDYQTIRAHLLQLNSPSPRNPLFQSPAQRYASGYSINPTPTPSDYDGDKLNLQASPFQQFNRNPDLFNQADPSTYNPAAGGTTDYSQPTYLYPKSTVSHGDPSIQHTPLWDESGFRMYVEGIMPLPQLRAHLRLSPTESICLVGVLWKQLRENHMVTNKQPHEILSHLNKIVSNPNVWRALAEVHFGIK